MSLARFHADPSLVSVSIRHCQPDSWVVTVKERGSKKFVRVTDDNPNAAVMRALACASSIIPGIDLDLQWAYEHPYPEIH